MQQGENMEPILPLVALFGALGFSYLALRAHQTRLSHHERLAALDKGVDMKPILLNATPEFGHRLYLLRALLWIFGGVALGGTLAVTTPLFQTRDQGPLAKLENKLARARQLKDRGATAEQIEALEVEIERIERRREPPPNMVVIGTIPIFIGFGYLIFFGLEEMRVRRKPSA
jgi:hypothetical protein